MNARPLVLGTALLAVCFTTADAATYRYRLGGDWTQLSDGTSPGWRLNDGSLTAVLPGTGDDARINWGGSTVTVSTTVPAVNRVQIGVDESGTVVVANGGVLTTTTANNNGDILAGNNNANATGSLIVQSGGQVNVGRILWAANNSSNGIIEVQSGGLVTVASHLWWGVTGSATISISGMVSQTGGILGLGTSNASSPSGGTAQVEILDGGVLALFNISANAGLPSIQAGSSIEIFRGGALTLPGQRVGTLQSYVDASKIVANGGTFDLSFDEGSNLTTLTVVPEPSAAVLLGLAFLGLAGRRRRI